jgi:hypothetical protein
MDLRLEPEDAALIERILSSYLSDLRMEIAGTDSPQWRRAMKQEEEQIGRLLDLLRRLIELEAGRPVEPRSGVGA